MCGCLGSRAASVLAETWEERLFDEILCVDISMAPGFEASFTRELLDWKSDRKSVFACHSTEHPTQPRVCRYFKTRRLALALKVS